jgi:predicted RNase H-like nuclease (RuvC/YqgF family)
MNKIITGLAVVIAVLIASIAYLQFKISRLENLNASLENKLELKQKESANYEASLALQSAQIKQFELDIKTAKTTLQNTNKEIDKKYKNIQTAADTCEAKLAAIKNISEAFYGKD